MNNVQMHAGATRNKLYSMDEREIILGLLLKLVDYLPLYTQNSHYSLLIYDVVMQIILYGKSQ